MLEGIEAHRDQTASGLSTISLSLQDHSKGHTMLPANDLAIDCS